MASLSVQTSVQTLYKRDEIALFLKQLVFGWWKIDLQVSAKWTTISRSSTEENDALCVVGLKKKPIMRSEQKSQSMNSEMYYSKLN